MLFVNFLQYPIALLHASAHGDGSGDGRWGVMLEVDEAGLQGNFLGPNLMEMRFARAPTLAKKTLHTRHFSEKNAAYSPLSRKFSALYEK